MARLDKERWLAASPWLDQLLDADPARRAALLAQVKTENRALAADLERLLASIAHVETEEFLEGTALDRFDTAALAGRTIGSYTFERPLGAGGMGTVWLARRSDGLYEGRVAVKLLNLALLGFGGAERFRREGSALAKLAHPNIAHLVDAGVAEGQPYLVLEHVEGQPIDTWCDERGLDVHARLRLFLDVLAAVAHAHGRLILHRDLKPSNILVTADGRVKLLDFGVAKLLDEGGARAEARTELTQLSGRAFTPDYAAPEQVQGTDVSTATDVYALGVMLFRLLAGSHPTPSASAAPVDRLRAIVESEARRPSEAAAAIDPDAARKRAATPQGLARALRGDLDNIVARSLKKAPGERYATVDAFAADLRRHLNQEPVSARPDSLAYRAGKFVRRNRFGVGAAAAILLAVLAGAVGTAWQAAEAARQRDRALAQLQRAETTSDFVFLMLFNAWGQDERISLDEFLGRSEELALRSLENQAEQKVVVLHALGSYYASLGNYTRARPLLRRAVESLSPSADASLRAQAECNDALMTGLHDDAATAHGTIARWVAHPDVEPAIAAQCEIYRAHIAQTHNDGEAALRHALGAKELLRKARRAPAALQATVHGNLGYGYFMTHRLEDADREYAAAMQILRNLQQADSAGAVATLNNWSLVSSAAGDIKRSLELLDEAIALAGRRGGTAVVPPYAASNRASALYALGRHAEAIDAADLAFAIAEKANHPGFKMSALLIKSGALAEHGDLAAAERVVAEAAALASNLPPGSYDSHGLAFRRTRIALLRGEPAAARAIVDPLVERLRDRREESVLASALRMRAEALNQQGERAAALRDAQDSLAIVQRLQGSQRHSLRIGITRLLIARIKHDAGDHEGARADAAVAAQHLDAMLDAGDPDRRLAHQLAAR